MFLNRFDGQTRVRSCHLSPTLVPVAVSCLVPALSALPALSLEGCRIALLKGLLLPVLIQPTQRPLVVSLFPEELNHCLQLHPFALGD